MDNTKNITTIKTLDDLRKAQARGLKRGDPITLADDAGPVKNTVFFQQCKSGYGEILLVTLERGELPDTREEGIVRSVYAIEKDGLSYKFTFQPEYQNALCNDAELFESAYGRGSLPMGSEQLTQNNAQPKISRKLLTAILLADLENRKN